MRDSPSKHVAQGAHSLFQSSSCTEISKWTVPIHRLIRTRQQRVSAGGSRTVFWTPMLWAPGLRGGACAPVYLRGMEHLSGGRDSPGGDWRRHRKVTMKLILCLPAFCVLSAMGMLEAGKNETCIFSSWASMLELWSPGFFSQKCLWAVRNQLSGTAGHLMSSGNNESICNYVYRQLREDNRKWTV